MLRCAHDHIFEGAPGPLAERLGQYLRRILAIGKFLRIAGNASYLITAGTAICGGSAITAIGPMLRADDEEMAVSLGTVFILNSVAHFWLFRPLDMFCT